MKTELILSIFGSERCVTMLENLEAVAHAITRRPFVNTGRVAIFHPRRGNRRPNQPDKRAIRPFRDGDFKALNVPALITYPARPIQGGRLELAPPKRGLRYSEPELNGWRALIHTPTGTMWNRHGALLTIADCSGPRFPLTIQPHARQIKK